MFVFEKDADKWFVLFRPSGTEPKLKAYGFGKDTNRLAIDAWSFGFNENVAGQLPQSFTGNPKLMEIWGEDGLKAVDKARRMQGAWEDYGRVIDPQDLNAGQMAELEQRKLVRTYSPPDNHLELVNQWLKARGLPEVNIDFSKPQAMPQAQIVELLEAIPPDVFNKLGNSKESVLQKERVSLASNAGVSRKQQVDDMEQIIAVPAENIIGHEAGFEKWIAGQPQNMAVVILAMPDEEQAVQKYKDMAWIKVVGKDISEEFRAKLIDLRALYGKEEFFGGFKLGTVNTIDDYKAVAGSIASGV